MRTKQNYGWLDRFRIVAALFVITIHTSPLATFHEGADFFLTRVLARIAVPFFFMVTGQFVVAGFFSPSARNTARLRKYLIKTSLLYLFCILLYLPIGIYAGHYEDISVGKALRMLFFDGTFYHLWYFPACILGVLLVYAMSRGLSLRAMTIVSAILYVIGLFGDSYYGLIQKVPVLEAVYEFCFQISSYTRNGLFFAPLFLVLGTWMGTTGRQTGGETASDRKKQADQQKFLFLCGMAVLSFALMTGEAFLLRYFDLQRHDSMYLALVPTMFFFYRCLLCLPKKSNGYFRAAATWIYMLHPAFIVVVRGIAKPLHLTELLVDNSLVHYIVVSLLSMIAGFVIAFVQSKLKLRSLSTGKEGRQTTAGAGKPRKNAPLSRNNDARRRQDIRRASKSVSIDIASEDKYTNNISGYEDDIVQEDFDYPEDVESGNQEDFAFQEDEVSSNQEGFTFQKDEASNNQEGFTFQGDKESIDQEGSNYQEYVDSTTPKVLKATKTVGSRAWIEVDAKALAGNVAFLRSRLPQQCRLMPAVKAEAYGHGAVLVSRQLNLLGVDAFCVASVMEAVQLREGGVEGDILILGYTPPEDFPLLARYQLIQTVIDYPYAQLLDEACLQLRVHIGIDTGMHRLGIRCENIEEIRAVYEMQDIQIDGLFTHLCVTDSPLPEHKAFTEAQVKAFYQVIDILRAEGYPCPNLHLLASYGILNLLQGKKLSNETPQRFADRRIASNELKLAADYVRPGIALYGVLSSEADTQLWRDSLKPVLSLKAKVTSLRNLYAGEAAGYGAAFTAEEDMQIAAISIGYADGLPRELSYGKGSILINGCKAPVIGRICMDQTIVDVSHIPNVQVGDAAVIIGSSGDDEITVGQIAEQCGTITNEILSRLGARLDRRLV